ncbi:hypothetical protein [Martelella radicis]|uniref:Uncharacterized protein n=1 Tax=Martelella radicis TaxID=1397476 RepID=A0A7W6P9U7_9HYPH|nr:hypothetical protein [Martelella radicis]MBB4120732.1 hypothetical protein [Martelella radicis]
MDRSIGSGAIRKDDDPIVLSPICKEAGGPNRSTLLPPLTTLSEGKASGRKTISLFNTKAYGIFQQRRILI